MPFPHDLLPTRSALARVGLERQWFGVVPLVETERLLKITLAPGLVFAQTDYAMLYTFDAESGRLLWSAQLGERTGFARGVAANKTAVFLTNANIMFALDKRTGRPIWRYNLGTIPTASPAATDERVVVGLTNGEVWAFDLKSRDEKGNETILTAPRPAWHWHAGGAITTRPLPSENIVAFGGGDNKVHVVMGSEATALFRIPTRGPVGEGLAAYGTRTLLIPSADYVLYAVDLFTANVKWTFASGAPIEQEPAVSDQDVYVVNTAGNITDLDPETGEPRWTTSTQGGRLAAISATKIYLRSYNRDLFVIDRKTGKIVLDPAETLIRAGLNLREYDRDIVNRFNDRLYFATSSGLVICIREAGQVQPRLLRDPNAPPFGYVPPEGIKLTPPVPPSAAPAEPGAEPAEPKKEPGAAPGGEVPPPEKEKEPGAEAPK
jgi:outer membrane protein assembly factor BamB